MLHASYNRIRKSTFISLIGNLENFVAVLINTKEFWSCFFTFTQVHLSCQELTFVHTKNSVFEISLLVS